MGVLGVFAYIQAYLPWKGKSVDLKRWKTTAPKSISLATGLGVGGGLCWIVGMWPLWNIFTIPIGFFLLMGILSLVGLWG